jgi:hypothetical protein
MGGARRSLRPPLAVCGLAVRSLPRGFLCGQARLHPVRAGIMKPGGKYFVLMTSRIVRSAAAPVRGVKIVLPYPAVSARRQDIGTDRALRATPIALSPMMHRAGRSANPMPFPRTGYCRAISFVESRFVNCVDQTTITCIQFSTVNFET